MRALEDRRVLKQSPPDDEASDLSAAIKSAGVGHRSGQQRRSGGRVDASDLAADALRQLPLGTRDWKRVLSALLSQHNASHARRDKRISYKTMHERQAFVYRFFAELRQHTPYANVDPRCIKPKHIEAVVARWRERGLSSGTIHNYVSYLRAFEGWIGKRGLVRSVAFYVGDATGRRHQSAVVDKSWEAHRVPFEPTLVRIRERCVYVAMALEFCRHFALRPREALMLRPHGAVIAREQATRRDVSEASTAVRYLRISRGAKGGRRRDVPIDTAEQTDVIARAQVLVRSGEPLARPGYSLKQNTIHFYSVLSAAGVTVAQLGVTAYGLRHGAAGDAYQDVSGAPAPVRGESVAVDPELDRRARDHVARLLGHGRREISNCYLGPPRTRKPGEGAGDPSASPSTSPPGKHEQ